MSEEKNSRIYEQIRAGAKRNALHHAMLLTGGTDGDRQVLAEYVAAAMECTAEGEKPCKICAPCRKVFGGIHPDVIRVKDEEHKILPVDTVRALCADVYIRPNEGARKVYLFEDCGQLDPRCQDILLKTVEEGPRYAAFLFLAENAAAILPTIRSRCVELKLHGGEDAQRDAEMIDRAMEFGDYLSRLREDDLVSYLCSLEGAKLKRGDLLLFFDAAKELCAEALLCQYGRKSSEMYGEMAEKITKKLTKEQLMGIIDILQKYKEQSEFNVGVGHMLGGFAAELSAFLSKK